MSDIIISYIRELQILGRERLRVRDFFLRITVSARKPASFWREKCDTVVIFTARFCKNVDGTHQVKNTVGVLTFFDQQNGIRVTDQPILLTKRKINRTGYKFLKYFRYKRAVKSRTRSRPCPRMSMVTGQVARKSCCPKPE